MISKAEYDAFRALEAQNAHLERQVEYLLGQMRLSRHKQFGASSEKSEYDMDQLNLFNEAEIFTVPGAPDAELIEVETHYRKRTRLTTDKLPYDLPVEVVEHSLPDAEQDCPCCGEHLDVMGREAMRRELVIIPG